MNDILAYRNRLPAINRRSMLQQTSVGMGALAFKPWRMELHTPRPGPKT